MVTLVAKGFTNGEIGDLLGLSAGTVKLHVSAIIRRLGASNRTEAASLWLSERGAPNGDSLQLASASDAPLTFRIDTRASREHSGQADAFRTALVHFLGERGHRIVATSDTSEAAVALSLGVNIVDDAIELTVLPGECAWTGAPLYRHGAEEVERLAVEVGTDLLLLSGHPEDNVVPNAIDESELADLLWRGARLTGTLSPDTLARGLGCLQKLIAEDPDNLPALVAFANGAGQMGLYAGGEAARLYSEAHAAAEAAIALDPSSAAAHAALGYAQMFGSWELDEAARSLHRAHLLDPGQGEAIISLSLLHMFRGNFDDALAYAIEGWRLNRAEIANYVSLGHVYRERGEPERAIRHLAAALELDRENLHAALWMALTLGERRRHAEARATLTPIARRFADSGLLLAASGYLHGLAGETPQAEACLAALREAVGSADYSPYYEGVCLVGLGRTDAAMAAFEASLDERIPLLLGWRCDPVYRPLRTHPRFDAVARLIGV